MTKKKPAPKSSGGSHTATAVAPTKKKKTAAKAKTTRHIGLSLGADICWAMCYEDILNELDLNISWKRQSIRLDVERVNMEPFNLSQPCKYDVLLDRITHWYPTTREWIKKAVIMDDLYVLNNPWSIQSMEKHSTYAAMMHLGMPIPETWMIPPKSYDHHPDLRPTLQKYAKLFDLGKVGEQLGYPLFMKPYDGGGWRDVSAIHNEQELRKRYDESGTQIMHLQKAVSGFDSFVRCIGLGPQTRLVNYKPDAPLHDRYAMDTDFVSSEEASVLHDMTLTINTFFGWDFNSCEALRKDDIWHPIDFANACPDSQVTSLHYHFPWLVIAKLKWSIFCAVTQRPMRRTMDWDPYYAVARKKDMPYRERLRAYAEIAEKRLDKEQFDAFCDKYLSHVDGVAWNYFGTERAKTAVRNKVSALYPAHEIDQFTELFWNRIQAWRQDNKPASQEA